ncbi:hypothetical protein HBI55_073720 [Parastagonospora nodorum]|nr:hypothetical protein HBI55_073720 [Parastagonospora nodorum]
MHQFGKSGDPHQFTVMSRGKGAPLRNVWPDLSREEQRSYVDQLVAAIRELRQYTAPYPQRVERWAQESRCRDTSCIEICDMVWAKLDAEHDSDAKHASKQFTKKVTNPVDEEQTVLRYCPITQTEAYDVWRRPAWCECKPLGGLINRRKFDSELKHEIDYSETAQATYNPEHSDEVFKVEESEVAEDLRSLSI